MGVICGCLYKLFVVSSLAILLFVLAAFYFGPGLHMQPKHFMPLPSPEFYGPFTVNASLEAAQRLFEKQILGSESLAIKDGKVFAGLNDGRILRIINGKLELLTKIGGNGCHVGLKKVTSKDESAELCGLPVGMRLDDAGDLVVADLNKGLYRVSTTTGNVIPLVPISTVIDGKRLLLPNDLTISTKGDIYFTETSTNWPLTKWGCHAGFLAFVENAASGRILHYDPQTKKVRTVVDKLYFPNGIQLSSKEEFLIFSQSNRFNILKYHLRGLQKGQLEVLVDNLPGHPDNIRPSGKGNSHWVALFNPRLPGEGNLFQCTSSKPFVRRVVYSTLIFAQRVINELQVYLPFRIMDILMYELDSLIWSSMGDKNYGLVFEMKEDGTILRSLHSPKGRLNQITQVIESNDILYFSSVMNNYIGKFKLYK